MLLEKIKLQSSVFFWEKLPPPSTNLPTIFSSHFIRIISLPFFLKFYDFLRETILVYLVVFFSFLIKTNWYFSLAEILSNAVLLLLLWMIWCILPYSAFFNFLFICKTNNKFCKPPTQCILALKWQKPCFKNDYEINYTFLPLQWIFQSHSRFT